MSTIINIIKGIGELISSIIGFVIKALTEIAQMVKALGSVIASMPSYLGFLPYTLISLFTLGLTVVILYKVLGRD